ncbi:PilC/PilY family type IV pilus protein [Microbulbifer hainanensis]|uniref:PilC/PilY family type IV pilus protein n=1 Tax=Microbulbifer hainanensis TaxID=2735675 RepID=UPI0018666FD1|nr:PilC/PilY family type IV pilus protein [Microbulbifer hainanensis]
MEILTGSRIRGLSLVVGSFALSSSILVSAETAPGAVADVPLVTQGGAKPNLMIMLDSSGSMGNKLDSGEKRTDVVKRAAKGLVDSLGDGSMRVGLSRFNGSEGARILYNLTLLDSTEKKNIKDGIDDIPASGVTPLAEAASDIGRYFTYGYKASGNLALHPENSFKQTEDFKSVSDIFEDQPDFKSGLTAPSQSVQYYCQKNFFMLLTDGEPNGDFDVSDALRDYDGDCTATSDDSDCRTHYSGKGSDYLDDVTTAMYDMDLRPDLDGPDASNPVKNNVSSYMVGFAEGSLANNPLLKSAAEQAGGKFLYASDSDALETAFQSILTDIFSKVGASSAASFNATSLSSNSVIYLASYNSEKWSGSLVAREFDPVTGKFNSTDKWSAQTLLDSRSVSTRLILTSEDGVGKEFEAGLIGSDPTDPSTPQQADLDINSASASNDGRGDERLDYIRGVRTNEGTDSSEFRLRDTALGDIVNSTPTFVGEPNFNYPDTDPFGDVNDRYSDFVAAAANRDPIVYVGANDGMLHGFDADTGEEKIAYIPELVLSTEATEGLHYLTSQNYGHRFYVNLTPTVADAFFDDDWHTVLIGGLGAGGKGYFVLDVTDPDDFSSGNASRIVMDEIGADDDDMGLSFSRPKVALLNNGRWAAIFGNGYNSDSGKAVLYIYYFDNGDIKKIDTGWTDSSGNNEKNGLSTPSLADTNGDGVVDRVYAGDVQGNMWAFDLCSLTNGVCSTADTSWSRDYGGPLFTTGTNTEPEPITTAPRIAKNTQVPNGPYPNLLVLFGSGQYLNSDDLQDTDAMAYYGVWDKGDDDLDSSDLVSRSFSVQSGQRTMSLAADPVDWSGGENGWKIPLQGGSNGFDEVTGGERVITESLLLGSVLFFNTAIPSTAVCSSGGTGYLMSVDFRSGLAPEVAVYDGNNDGVIDDADKGYVGELASSLGDDGEHGGGGIPTDPAIIRKSDGSGASRSGGSGQFCINVSGEPDCGPREWYVGNREGRLSWQEVSPF